MKQRKIYALIILSLVFQLALFLAISLAPVNLAAAMNATPDELSSGYQILATPTPELLDSEVVLTTNPALLQAMIFLSIVAVCIIFWGVWINRRKLDLR
jgi:hypothetical protein